MVDKIKGHRFGWADALVALSVCAPILIPLGGEAVMLLLTAVGVWLLIKKYMQRKGGSNQDMPWRRGDTILAICMASMFVLQLISVLWAQWPRQALASAFKHLHFLMWPTVMVVLSMSRRTTVVASWSLVFALLACACWILFMVATVGWQGMGRFEAAAQNPSVFGRIVAFYGLWALLLASAPRVIEAHGVPPQWLLAMASLAGLLLVVSSGNRIELVAYVILILIVVVWRMLQRGQWHVVWGMGVGVLLAVVFAAQSIGIRLDQGMQEVRSYFAQSTPKVQDMETSVGLRIEIYYIATRAISERPWFGWGAGSRPQNFRRLSHYPEHLPTRTHLHSQYLQTLTDVGIVGSIVALLATLAAIWATVIRPWKAGHREMAALFACLIGLHLASGVFNPAFSQGLSNSVFVMMMALLWVMLRQQEAAA
jgi:O-antigen ligase